MVAFLQSAVGPDWSRTVTRDVQVAVLPLPSVAVKVITFNPILAHVNTAGLTERFNRQLSEDPLFTVEGDNVKVPLEGRLTTAFLQIAVGGVTSRTVTTALQEAVLPWPSFTVNVTVLSPTLLHVNALGVTDTRLTMPQLSVPLWKTLPGVILTFPAGLRLAVKFWQTTVGARLSETVTVAEQVAVLPLPSFTVSVTVFTPRLAQVNAAGVTDWRFTVPQLSLPLR